METLRRSFCKVRARRRMFSPEPASEYQEGLSKFQVNCRRRESVRVKRISGGRAGLEREIKKKMSLEESVCLGSAKLISASKSESQILEASKTLLLGCSRLDTLRTELGLLTRGEWRNLQRSRLAEVSLSDLRIPLAWKQRDQLSEMGDNKKFAVFCIIRSGTQVYDTSLISPIDRSVTDLSFSDIFGFSNLPSDFVIKIEVYSHCISPGLLGTPKNWIRKIKSKITTNQKTHSSRVASFDLLAETSLTIDDAKDAIECHDLDKTAATATTSAKDHQMPQLFGQICFRLAVSPYCKQEPLMTGSLSVSWPESEIIVPGCFARLMNWKLEIWSSTAQFRRGEQPWKVVSIDSMSLVREMGDKFCVENEKEEHADFICDTTEEITDWVEEILNNIEDYSKWNKAAIDQMEVLSPNMKNELGVRRLRQKTKSKLMMLYNRISSNDLQGMNFQRNEIISRGSERSFNVRM
eukprot:GFUD01045444.1.p1 GENE.GFUD01045444.1~~GFUD01045444.1.p1  ORF type:complete len:466 (-),score=129.25 GFUD01045444.1:22-1419(-)